MSDEIEYCTKLVHSHTLRGRHTGRCLTCGKPTIFGLRDEKPKKPKPKDVIRGEASLAPLAEFIAAAGKVGGTACRDSTLFEPVGEERLPNNEWLASVVFAAEQCAGCLARFECAVYSNAVLQELEVGAVVAGMVVWKDQRYGKRRLATVEEIQEIAERKLAEKAA